MTLKYKIILILIIIVGIFGFLIYKSIGNSLAYYYTVSELEKMDIIDQEVRVKGILEKSSLVWQPDIPLLIFNLTDGNRSIKMTYQGILPDNFYHADELIVEGKMNNQGEFIVSKLMLQCPSKYEKESDTDKGGK